MSNEADTCRKFVVPKLRTAGWDHSEPEVIHLVRRLDQPPRLATPKRSGANRMKAKDLHHGNVDEIIGKFGGADQMREVVGKLQTLLYTE
jgi:hypothetical protein